MTKDLEKAIKILKKFLKDDKKYLLTKEEIKVLKRAEEIINDFI